MFAAEKPAETPKLEEIIAKAQSAVNTMAVEVQKALGVKELPEPQKVADSIIQSGKNLAKEIQDIVTEVRSFITFSEFAKFYDGTVFFFF